MLTSDALSRLLLLLYEGVSDPQSTQRFLDELALFVGASGGAFREQFFDEAGCVQLKRASLFLTTGYSPEALQLYGEYYHTRDILVQRALEKEYRDAQCATSDAVMPAAEFHKTEIFNDYYPTFELGPTMWAKLAEKPSYVAAISFQRPASAPEFAENELKLLISLAPHMRQMLRLSQVLRDAETEKVALSAKLEELDVAICMIRTDGSIARLTPAAESILKQSSGILVRNGKLEVSCASEQRALDALIAGACSTAQGSGIQDPVGVQARSVGTTVLRTWTAPAGGAMLISRKPPLRALQVVVSPFCPSPLLGESHIAALVQLSDPSAIPRPRSAVLRALYGLTPTESRLADLLLQGLDVREAANRMRITLETARFQLKRLLAKTGSHRQAELMRLMLSLPGV